MVYLIKKSEKEIRALVTDEMVQAANALCMAKAFVQTIRPIVRKYQEEILTRHQFTNKGEVGTLNRLQANGRHLNEKVEEAVVLNPEHIYLMSDEDANIYFAEVEQARIKSGLRIKKEGNCPLLEAESLERKAERVFVDAMEPITKMNHERVWSSSNAIENAKKLTNLGLGLIASLGLLKNTLNKAA